MRYRPIYKIGIKTKFLAKNIGKKVKIVLKNGYLYGGEVLSVDESDVLFLEDRLGEISLSLYIIQEVQLIQGAQNELP